ncbi:glutamyl-tRNA reductase [Metabacillus sp. GX 13764]|uniref:glutamyl-tRNA reductase n=1 Tax=Metabacillus kandeliae TaxID=2900151 RepID=UPI001E3B1DC4|nr:glutamyl-tRNA reductase [Metabacillus kandeliae]MCD7032888.1 glutamyl-tRNA reductase [Metabacillus kandeliae]
MHVLTVGLNHKTAPVEIREKLSFNPDEIGDAMKTLKTQKSVLENIIVSTCNRTEIYAVVDQLHTGRYYLKAFLADWFQLPMEEFSPFLSFFENDGAVEHLFRVACGLDSMILGETQILGQVRTSFMLGQELDTTGTVLNHLMKEAVTLAKKGHSETDIGSNAVSVSYAAVELAKKIFGDLHGRSVLILGAGKMGELAAKNLHGSGACRVTVMNRTYEKANMLAAKFSGEARHMDELSAALAEADIVISSTGSKDYVITKKMMANIERERKGRPLFMVDIAVPRDLDPELEQLESIFLYDIDDLEGIVQANLQERKAAADEIGIMVEAEIVAFNEWLRTLGVVPVISALRQKALGIQAQTMESIERKMPNLTEREKKVLNKHTKSIINQLLKDPILKVKELAAEPDAEETLALFKKIFDIEEETEQQKKREAQASITADAVKAHVPVQS